ncbi:hypothetical protein NUSPORA_00107 [Nucleospora cyclopteri]
MCNENSQNFRVTGDPSSYRAKKQVNTGKNANEISHWHIQIVETEKLKININGTLKPINKWICLVGLNGTKKIQTSVVTEAISHNKVRTAKSLYFLNDPTEVVKYPLINSLERHFSKGFFQGWDEKVYDVLHAKETPITQINEEKLSENLKEIEINKEPENVTNPDKIGLKKTVIRKKPLATQIKKLKSKKEVLKKSLSVEKDNKEIKDEEEIKDNKEIKDEEDKKISIKDKVSTVKIKHNPNDTLLMMSKKNKLISDKKGRKSSLGTCLKQVNTQSSKEADSQKTITKKKTVRTEVKKPMKVFQLDDEKKESESEDSLKKEKSEESVIITSKKLSIEKGYYYRDPTIPPTIKEKDLRKCEKNFTRRPSIEISSTKSSLIAVENDKEEKNTKKPESKPTDDKIKKGKIKVANTRAKKLKKKNLLFKPKKK